MTSPDLVLAIDRAVRRIVMTMLIVALGLGGAFAIYITRQYRLSSEDNRTLTAIRYILCANQRLPSNDANRLRCGALPGLVPYGRQPNAPPRDS